MKVSDIGEFGLIRRIAEKPKRKEIVKGIGDDAAVLKLGNKLYCVTTDTLVENDHFTFKWFTPKQVGMKAIEVNVSDITAMGGTPLYILVSLVLPKDIEITVIDELYKGMRNACNKHNCEIVGGNMTHGQQLVIDIDMIGEVKKQNICYRSDAKPGDFIFVSGDLGKSCAGLNMFLNGKKPSGYIKKAHTEPKAKPEKVRKFLKFLNAMIDVSDGLASDITRICEQSKCGAVIYKNNIPLHQETIFAAKQLKKDPYDFALYGGEDFELIFTVSEKNLSKVKGFLIGEIRKKKGMLIFENGKERLITKHGYDHFKASN